MLLTESVLAFPVALLPQFSRLCYKAANDVLETVKLTKTATLFYTKSQAVWNLGEIPTVV